MGDGAEAKTTEQHVPEGGGDERGGQHGHPGRAIRFIVGKQFIRQPGSGDDGQQADQGRGHAQGQQVNTEEAHRGSGPVKEEHLFASEGGDKQRCFMAKGNLGGQHAVRGLVVVWARGDTG